MNRLIVVGGGGVREKGTALPNILDFQLNHPQNISEYASWGGGRGQLDISHVGRNHIL